MMTNNKNIMRNFKPKNIVIMLLLFSLLTLTACSGEKNNFTAQNKEDIKKDIIETSKETDMITPTTITQVEKSMETIPPTTAQKIVPNYSYAVEGEEDSDYLDDDEIKTDTTKKKPHGTQLYGAQHHNELVGKKNVITHDGGGMGAGGGAAKSSGGKAGKSIDFSDAGTANQEVIKNSASDTDGKDIISETMGFAKDNGEFYKENEGDYAGVRIFELDRNGGFGFDEDHIGVSNIKGFMSFFLFAAFGLGGLSFFMATRDVRSKNNYF